MSEKELEELVEKNAGMQSVDTETGLQVAEKIAEIAEKEDVRFAIAGGLAMHLYGFQRATKDVDFLADKRLSLNVLRYLSFGGERYEIKIDGKEIDVDWIIRRDKYQIIYREALTDAADLKGWKIITPEWLVILKYIAGRGKDRLDLLWLLQQKDLVNRRKIKANLIKVLGDLGSTGYLVGLQREYDLADVMARRSGDENESYIDDDDEYPNYNE